MVKVYPLELLRSEERLIDKLSMYRTLEMKGETKFTSIADNYHCNVFEAKIIGISESISGFYLLQDYNALNTNSEFAICVVSRLCWTSQ